MEDGSSVIDEFSFDRRSDQGEDLEDIDDMYER